MVVLALAFLLFAAVDEVEGKTLTVDDEGSAEYTKIQDAVDDAEDGDTVYIYNGEYDESVDFSNKYITFEGESREGVVVNYTNGYKTFYANFNEESFADQIKFFNLTIHCFDDTGLYMNFWQFPLSHWSLLIDNCTVSDTANDGISIEFENNLYDCDFLIDNCAVFSCYGDGIYIYVDEAEVPLRIEDCEIFDNGYRGIYVNGDSLDTLELSTSRIHHNNLKGGSSAIDLALEIEDVFIENCEIYENVMHGIEGSDRQSITLLNSWILANGRYGTVFHDVDDVNLSNNVISNNTGGIDLWIGDGGESEPTIKMYNNNFSGNEDAGLVCTFQWGNDEVLLNFENNSFYKNELGFGVSNHEDFDTSAYVFSPDSTFTNNMFMDNYKGMAIYDWKEISIENCFFNANEIGLDLWDYNKDISIENCLFESNGNGLNVTVDSEDTDNIKISNNSFFDNKNGIYLEYNIYDELPAIEIAFNEISDNTNGIKAYVDYSGKGGYLVDVYYNEIIGNTANGVIYTGDTRNTIKAQNNWWGVTSGPYHSSSNPDGEGDEVSNNVNFDPWLESSVKNKYSPKIITEDVKESYEDVEYSVDYNATDDDGDEIMWILETNATFLELDSETGILKGTPAEDVIGWYYVNVTASDGKRIDYHNFTLTVIEVNEKPIITTTDTTQTLEDEVYSVNYEAVDGNDDTLTWSLTTNASFLIINTTTGKLNGTPEQKDVGNYWVNVSVSDGEYVDSNNFTLEVINVNDIPTLTITDPLNDSTVQWDLTIIGISTDADNDIKKIEIKIDGGGWQEADGTTEWSFTINTTTLENGWYNISVRAFDGEGYSIIQTVQVEVDNPESEIKRPDFEITNDDINLLGPKEKGKTTNISVIVHNIGDQDGVVEVKLYLNLILEESLIHNESIEIQKESIKTLVTKWTPLYKGDAEIIVVLEDKSTISEEDGDNNQASKSFSINDEQAPGGDGENGDDDDSPAFSSPVIVSATALGALVFFFRRRFGNGKV